jgi:hypothetical protein
VGFLKLMAADVVGTLVTIGVVALLARAAFAQIKKWRD